MLHTRIWRVGRAIGLLFTVAALAACGARTVVPAIDVAFIPAADGGDADVVIGASSSATTDAATQR